jgi:hypothetical protein
LSKRIILVDALRVMTGRVIPYILTCVVYVGLKIAEQI